MTERPSNYARNPLEKYFTPAWAIHAVLPLLRPGLNYDPAAGDGAVLRACWAAGVPAHGGDLQPDAPGIAALDFLADDTPRRCILTNPPYGAGGRLAIQFITHALDVTRAQGGQVAMLLRADFDSAGGRTGLFRDHPAFEARGVLLKRVKWTNVKDSGATPTQNHTWFVWDWSRVPGTARVVYLGG